MPNKKQTKTNKNHTTHTNFSKFLVTVIIFLSVMVLALFSILWTQIYESQEKQEPLEESEETSLVENLPAEPRIASDISMEEVKELQTDQNEEWTGEVSIKPINSDNFVRLNIEKSGLSSDFDSKCGSEIVYYLQDDTRNEYESIANFNQPILYIANRNMDFGIGQREGFEALYNFVNSDTPTIEDYNNLTSNINIAFGGLCEIDGYAFFKENALYSPQEMNYPGTDKAVMINSNLYAIKGDYLILIRNNEINRKLRSEYLEECQNESDEKFNDQFAYSDCIESKLTETPNLAESNKNEVQNLIELFKLQ